MRGAVLLTLIWLAAPGPDARAEGVPDGLAARAWAITDVVLDHHLSPPTRPQMILDALRAVYKGAGVIEPPGLARKVSLVSTPEQLTALLQENWPSGPAEVGSGVRRQTLAEIFAGGIVSGVAGDAWLANAKDVKAEQQIAANQYVGLQIAIMHNEELNRPQIKELFEGGPAQRAGVLKDDLIEAIDGKTTEGLKLQEVVYRLRGAEGTEVVIQVRQPKAATARTFTIKRGVLPRETIEGVRSYIGGEALAKGPGLISYLKLREIAGSTPQELRQLARALEDGGARALILDLRGVGEAPLHPAILLADELLAGGVIGRLRTTQRIETFKAEPDALFREWPLALLVDAETLGAAEWVAAALQDNHRATLVGTPTGRPGGRQPAEWSATIRTAVAVGDGSELVKMPTGRLEHGDGRPLFKPGDRPRRAGIAAPGDGNLVPDVLVDSPPSRRAQARPGTPEVDPNLAQDACLAVAVRRMREALKLPPFLPHTVERAALRGGVGS